MKRTTSYREVPCHDDPALPVPCTSSFSPLSPPVATVRHALRPPRAYQAYTAECQREIFPLTRKGRRALRDRMHADVDERVLVSIVSPGPAAACARLLVANGAASVASPASARGPSPGISIPAQAAKAN